MRNIIVIAAAVLCIVIALVSEAELPISPDSSTPLIGHATLLSDKQNSDTRRTSGEESLISQVCKGCRIAALDNSQQLGFVGRA